MFIRVYNVITFIIFYIHIYIYKYTSCQTLFTGSSCKVFGSFWFREAPLKFPKDISADTPLMATRRPVNSPVEEPVIFPIIYKVSKKIHPRSVQDFFHDRYFWLDVVEDAVVGMLETGFEGKPLFCFGFDHAKHISLANLKKSMIALGPLRGVVGF